MANRNKKHRHTEKSRTSFPNSRKLRCELLEDRRMLAVVTVDTVGDVVDFNDGVTSLREAIFATNLVAGADEIRFDFGFDGPATILLTEGELTITDSLTITGSSAELLAIDASGNDPTPNENNGDGSRVIVIDDSNGFRRIDVTIIGVSLTGGDIGHPTNAFFAGGGGIRSMENLRIVNARITDNAGSFGAGVWSRGDLTIIDTDITDNESSWDGGGVYASDGEVEIIRSNIESNAARFDGGGISLERTGFSIADSNITNNTSTRGAGVNFEDSRGKFAGGLIQGNVASAFGGGMQIVNSDVLVKSTTIELNLAGRGGGGLAFGSSDQNSELTVENTAILENSANGGGGGIRILNGQAVVQNSTISNNTAGQSGGGIQAAGNNLTITHSTITGNTARLDGQFGSGGGISLQYLSTTGLPNKLYLNHTIVAGNIDKSGIAPNINATPWAGASPQIIFIAENSIIGEISGSNFPEAPLGSPDANGNLIGGPINGIIDPLLSPLADNGGPTLTHALLPGSPAINAGDLNAIAGIDGVPLFDQRGNGFNNRIFSGRIDIGAYERQRLSDLTLLVDTLVDESDGDYSRGDLSFREAIELANANPVLDTIRFDPIFTAITGPLPATILLTMGELVITDSVDILGLGAEQLIIDASGNDSEPERIGAGGSRIFNINDGRSNIASNVTIDGLTLTGGDSRENGGAIFTVENLTVNNTIISGNSASTFNSRARFGGGGGIYARPIRNGALTISNSSITGNSTPQFGGGVYIYNNEAEIRIIDSEISNNSTNKVGGGISIWSTTQSSTTDILRTTIADNTTAFDGAGIRIIQGRLNVVDSTISGNSVRLPAVGGGIGAYQVDQILIERSTISGNQAGSYGGGIFFDRNGRFPGSGELIIRQSTLSNNRAAWGGALAITRKDRRSDLAASVTIVGTTISGNEAYGDGGGIWLDGFLRLAHSTITDNTSDINNNNKGVGGGIFISAGLLEIDHSIVAGNFDNTGAAHDIAGIVNSSFSLIGFGAEFLGPLADNGGPTFTHALLPGSPAIDAGDSTLQPGVNGTPELDQRGIPFSRVDGSRIDIGALEVQPVGGSLTADFDGDGDTDGGDFLAWQRGFGSTSGGTNKRDLAVWEARFGEETAVEGAGILARDLAIEELQFDAAEWVDLAVAVSHVPGSANQLRQHGSRMDKVSLGVTHPHISSFSVTVASEPRHPRPTHSASSHILSTVWKTTPSHQATDLLALDETFARATLPRLHPVG